MIVAINAVNAWLGQVLYTITHLEFPSGINNSKISYGVIVLFMFLIRLGYKMIKMFLTKNHNKGRSNGKDK